jgi:hypothetical protein
VNSINSKIHHLLRELLYLSNKIFQLKFLRKLQDKSFTQYLINLNKFHNVLSLIIVIYIALLIKQDLILHKDIASIIIYLITSAVK